MEMIPPFASHSARGMLLRENAMHRSFQTWFSLLQRAQETAAKPQERLRLEMLRLSFAELSRLLGRHGLADADASPPEITRPSDVAAATTNRRSGFALALSPRATPDADKIAVIANWEPGCASCAPRQSLRAEP